MKILLDELLARFPEIAERTRGSDEEMPYLALGCLVDWLDDIGRGGYSPAIVQRVVDFAKWCSWQPAGQTAADDVPTIYAVALFENLFLHEHTKSLIPYLTSKVDLEASRQYLVAWVEKEDYDEALEQFQRTLAACNEQYGDALKRLAE